ncbi:aldose 1-epimerase [Cohnella sp. WQ 127256]|uniref:aldose 1-epimerase n=1 Tax=Cohnella sp. WQ 127256 TaxID=2938790 RepID=UPI002118B455|nr:aldose 1-epimerase [Cohnella sp. WQ 127256]
MRFHAFEENHGEHRVVVLEDRERDSRAVILPSIGFNLIRCRLEGHETIEGPPDIPTLASRSSEFGVPLLWPPGRIAGGRFTYQGKAYTYPVHEGLNHLHGEIRMRPWQVISLETSEEYAAVIAELRFERTDAEQAYYPHDVVLRMTWRLSGNRISGALEVINKGDEEVPYAFGLHPYFSFPGKLKDIELSASVGSQYIADADGIFRRSPMPTDLCEKMRAGLSLDRLPADCDHFVFRMDGTHHYCQIVRQEEDIVVHFEFDKGFPYLVVFKPKWANALSLEPWSSISDAYNSPLSSELTGAVGLKAGERRRMEWAWQVEQMTR